MKQLIESTQQLGRALMLPIAVLPVAALMLRLGQDDIMAYVPFLAVLLKPMAAAGGAIFDNMGLLFAIGVAVGLARENHGAAGLAALIGFVVATKGAESLITLPSDPAMLGNAAALAAAKAKQIAKLSVPIGIISGLMAGWLYNRYSDIRLPSYLAFFGGRRFVPIVTGGAGLVLATVVGLSWSYLAQGMDMVSNAVMGAGEVGLFIYGALNRLLIVTGLHHIINNVAWQLLGDFNGVTGDLNRFFKGDPAAGAFMSGFFPVMMFGLPAACLAMYRSAMPERRRATGGLLLSMALTSFLTGVTEPIEFSFMFLAPMLYAVHAVLTGAAMVTMDLLNSRMGFSFSAGLFDYVINFKLASNPWLLIPVGAVYFALYYSIFRFCIVRFNLRTPGRELEDSSPTIETKGGSEQAQAFIAALGGAANLGAVNACTTRLRLILVNRESVNEAALRMLGARGLVKVGNDGLQVVLGPIADQVAGDIRAGLGNAPPKTAAPTNVAANLSSLNASTLPALDIELIRKTQAALGGAGNIRKVEHTDGRVLITVATANVVDEAALQALYMRGIARPQAGCIHLLSEHAASLAQQLAV